MALIENNTRVASQLARRLRELEEEHGEGEEPSKKQFLVAKWDSSTTVDNDDDGGLPIVSGYAIATMNNADSDRRDHH